MLGANLMLLCVIHRSKKIFLGLSGSLITNLKFRFPIWLIYLYMWFDLINTFSHSFFFIDWIDCYSEKKNGESMALCCSYQMKFFLMHSNSWTDTNWPIWSVFARASIELSKNIWERRHFFVWTLDLHLGFCYSYFWNRKLMQGNAKFFAICNRDIFWG